MEPIYRIRHKATGLYFTPYVSNNDANLNIGGFLFVDKPDLNKIGDEVRVFEQNYRTGGILATYKVTKDDFELIEYIGRVVMN